MPAEETSNSGITCSEMSQSLPLPVLGANSLHLRKSSMCGINGAIESRCDLPVVFMFPGGGAQYGGMGKQLYDCEPVYRSHIDYCADVASRHLLLDLREALYADASSGNALQRPSIALTALFVTEYALAKLWMSWGVQPVAMIGHSLGEYVAACLADVFSLEDAINLVSLRGFLFERIETGAMLSVPLPREVVLDLLTDRLSLAAVNAPALCVVSGPLWDIEQFEKDLEAIAVDSQRIPITVPAHSSLLDPVLSEFLEAMSSVRLQPPAIEFISNVTGTWISDAEARDPEYWTRHLRQTVQFADGMNTLVDAGCQIFLEVGPGRVLSSLTRLQACTGNKLILPSMRCRKDPAQDATVILGSLRQLRLVSFESAMAPLHSRNTDTTSCSA